MRVRRLLGRRKLPSSKHASQPAFREKFEGIHGSNDRVRQTPRSLPLPTAFSPRHPNSFRMEHGLYKYSTGMRIPSSSIKQSFGATNAALKVYSAEALSLSECTDVRRLIHAEDNYPPATSLIAALRHLYHVAAKAYTVVESILGAFFQVSRNGDGLRSLRLPWITLSPLSRQWNLYCETYRSHPHSTIGVPRICLSIISFRGRFEVPHGPWSKAGSLIGVQLWGDLRTSILQGDGTEEQASRHASDRLSNISFQTIVDDIVCAMAKVTRRSGIENHEDLITKLRNAISMNLTTSALPSFVKFRDMEITLMEPSRQRYVSNALLNPDGSERYGDINVNDMQKNPIIVTGGNQVNSSAMSAITKGKLGAEILKASVDASPETPHESPPITAAELAQEFDMLCRNSDQTGLGCCIKAVNALEQRHKDIHGRLAFIAVDPFSPTPRKAGEAVFCIRRKSPLGQHFIEIGHKGYPVKVRLSDSAETIVRVVDARLGFDLWQDSDPNLEDFGYARSTATDEVSVLSLAFDSILREVLNKMEFRSLEEAPYKLAEAVLEVLKVPSSGIMIKAVSLCIQPVGDAQTLFRAQASRATEPYSTGNVSDAAVLPSNNALAKCKEVTTPAGQTMHEASYQTPHAEIGTSMPTGRLVENTAISKYRASGLELWKVGEPNFALTSRWATSKILEGKTGFDQFRIMLAWPTSIDRHPLDITAERVTQAVEDTIQTCSRGGLWSFQTILSKMLEFESLPQHVSLYFRKTKLPPPIDIRRAPGRAGLSIMITNAKPTGENNVSEIDNVLSIALPAFRAPVELDGQNLAPDTEAHIMYNLEGKLLHKVHDEETTAAEQMCRVFQIVHRISAGFLKDRSFPSFTVLASGLVDAVFEGRHEFGAAIDVRSVKLTAQLRDHIPHNAPIARAEFSRTAGSKGTEEGKVESEPSEINSLMLDQAEETEIAEEAGLELQPAETTLSILEPRNDAEAVSEQSAIDLESPTSVPESTKPGDEAKHAQEQSKSGYQLKPETRTAFIALGSNVGDRLDNIENACREMDADPDIRIVRTSPLYETHPMYVADQDSFLNGACEIQTSLKPFELLDRLKAIEDRLGRVKTIEKGPRSIDLDILLYDKLAMATDRLTIPHPLMQEREFVLRPMADIPYAKAIEIQERLSIRQALRRLPKTPDPIYPSVPLGPGSQYLHASNPNKTTRIMSVLNVTPDSFSDGGDNQVSNIENLRETIRAQIEAGATIIDVGGQSSRPNAPDVTAEEEISRVLPAIEAIRSLPEAANVAISVDTYRAPVAEAAIKAGAHIINDISAGQLDPDMLTTVARLGCTYVMMHMRGTPSTMMNPENCTYETGVIHEIVSELRSQVARAEAAGIRRWRIILDPGIGFSKTSEQNLEVLRLLERLRKRLPTYPWLVGTSRKSFIGKITGVKDPKERVWGTAATVTAAVQGGADIVRVHDVREMADVVKMADSMYRS